MFSGLLHQLSGLGFKKGTFWDVFRLWGLLVEQLLVSEGSGLPSSLSPLLHLNWLFWLSCWDPLTIFHKMVMTATSETISIFLLIQLDCIGKTGDIANWLICSTNPSWGFWVFLLWRLSLFFLFWLYIWVPFSSNAFHYGRLSHECMIALQLPRGKQVPQCLWLHNIWSSSCGGLWAAGDL